MKWRQGKSDFKNDQSALYSVHCQYEEATTLDSGATEHVVKDLKYVHKLHKVDKSSCNLPTEGSLRNV